MRKCKKKKKKFANSNRKSSARQTSIINQEVRNRVSVYVCIKADLARWINKKLKNKTKMTKWIENEIQAIQHRVRNFALSGY